MCDNKKAIKEIEELAIARKDELLAVDNCLNCKIVGECDYYLMDKGTDLCLMLENMEEVNENGSEC